MVVEFSGSGFGNAIGCDPSAIRRFNFSVCFWSLRVKFDFAHFCSILCNCVVSVLQDFCSASPCLATSLPALPAVCTQPACAAGASTVAQSGRARLRRERQVATRSTRKTSIALFDSKSRCVTLATGGLLRFATASPATTSCLGTSTRSSLRTRSTRPSSEGCGSRTRTSASREVGPEERTCKHCKLRA